MKEVYKMNNERICKHCKKPYKLGTSGAGYKYCSRYCAKIEQQKQMKAWEAVHGMTVAELREEYYKRRLENQYSGIHDNADFKTGDLWQC